MSVIQQILALALFLTTAFSCNQAHSPSSAPQPAQKGKISTTGIILKDRVYKTQIKNEEGFTLCGNVTAPDVKPALLLPTDKLAGLINRNFDRTVNLSSNRGDIYIEIMVNCKGETGNYHVLISDIPELNIQIIRSLQKFAKWKPGRKSGTPCDSRVKMHFAFLHGKIRIVND